MIGAGTGLLNSALNKLRGGLVNPILSLSDLNIYIDMTQGAKTFDGSELTAVAAAAGDLSSISEITDGQHALWNAGALNGKGGMEMLATTRMKWGTFLASDTRSLMFVVEIPDPVPSGAQNMGGWLNSTFTSVNTARMVKSTGNRIQYSVNSGSAAVNISPEVVAGGKHIILLEFDTGVCNAYFDDFSTPHPTFIPNTNYNARLNYNLGARSSANDAFPGLIYGDTFMKKTWLTAGEKTAVFNYLNTYYELGL